MSGGSGRAGQRDVIEHFRAFWALDRRAGRPSCGTARSRAQVDICKVVVPSNDGGDDTKVVLGTELTENASPVLVASVTGVTCVVSDESAMRCVSASSERFALRPS